MRPSAAQSSSKMQPSPQQQQQQEMVPAAKAAAEKPELDVVEDMTVDELAQWLQSKTQRFAALKDDFLKQRIDGKCFLLLTHDLLREVSPSSPVGDRLHILEIREDMARVSRMAKRSQVVLAVKDVHINPPGVKGEVVLTHSNLKLMYVSESKNKTDALGSTTTTTGSSSSSSSSKGGSTRVVKSKYLDLVDLLTIEDVDKEETEDVKTTVTYEEKVCVCVFVSRVCVCVYVSHVCVCVLFFVGLLLLCQDN